MKNLNINQTFDNKVREEEFKSCWIIETYYKIQQLILLVIRIIDSLKIIDNFKNF